MRLRQLQCFREVMVSGTMTAAAKRLNTSQPGVSNLIAALEHEIGFELFERKKGRLIPTPEARHFYQNAERLVAELEEARRAARQIADGKRGFLTVATLPGMGLSILPKVISELRLDRPDTRVRILSRSTHAVRMMIPSEQCDVAIVETPIDDLAGHSEVFQFECIAIMPSDHALSELEIITPEAIGKESLVSLYSEHPTTVQLERAFFGRHVRWDPVVQSRLFATCCEIVASGGGIAIVDPMTAARYAGENLVVRRFEPQIIFEFAITLPGDGPYSRLTKEFVARLKSEMQPFVLTPNEER
ncbi:MAG: LysR family transcriptional regulator [Pseudomonadota bacterium]